MQVMRTVRAVVFTCWPAFLAYPWLVDAKCRDAERAYQKRLLRLHGWLF
jgi:hypothetical protein